MFKKILKVLSIVILISFLGGVLGVIFDRILIPRMASIAFFQRFKIFRQVTEQITVIEKTKEVVVKEDFSVRDTAEKVLSSLVLIVDVKDSSLQAKSPEILKNNEIQDRSNFGVILTSDGLIMTFGEIENKEGSKKIVLSDGRVFEGKFLNYDTYSEVTFFKIDASNLPSAPIGDSQGLETGEKITIASFGENNQPIIFRGIVSEKADFFSYSNSELSFSDKLEGVILTDIDIKPDMAGSVAIDFAGTVVGLIGNKEKNGSPKSFIIPINKLKSAIDKIITVGKIERPKLGAYYLSINQKRAILENLNEKEGALIYSFSGQKGLAMVKNSPASKSGLNLLDLIIQVDGEKITAKRSLAEIISEKSIGQKIKLKLIRQGKEIETEVVLN